MGFRDNILMLASTVGIYVKNAKILGKIEEVS
jgi:hypothetical protein